MVDTEGEALPARFGKYEVETRVAVGGMAEVYAARTPAPVVRRVAVKCIKPAFAADPGFARMFMDEARVVAGFDHPNVVRVLDFEPGDPDRGEPPYLVMEFIDGYDLRTLIWEASLRRMWVPFDHVAAIVAQAARGLHYAHTFADADGRPLEVIHRDMSPQNVMLTRAGLAKVVDFGIARAAGRATRTQAGIIKGKFAYLSPEQVRGEPLDPRSDVFALGILLYEVLTYRNPFRKDRDDATLVAITDEAPASPATLRPDLPDDLAAVVLRALEKDRDARFPSALALAEALEASVASRRAAVTDLHLADFLRGLEAVEVPQGARPAREPDGRLPQGHLREYARETARTELGLPVFAETGPAAAAPPEGEAPTVLFGGSDAPGEEAPAEERTVFDDGAEAGPARTVFDAPDLPPTAADGAEAAPARTVFDEVPAPAPELPQPGPEAALSDEATLLRPSLSEQAAGLSEESTVLRPPLSEQPTAVPGPRPGAAVPGPADARAQATVFVDDAEPTVPGEEDLRPAPGPRFGLGLQVAIVVAFVLAGVLVGAWLGLRRTPPAQTPVAAPTAAAPRAA